MENTTLLAPKQTLVWDNTSSNSSSIFFYQRTCISTTGIRMGTKYAPALDNPSLYHYEADFIQEHLTKKDKKYKRQFRKTYISYVRIHRKAYLYWYVYILVLWFIPRNEDGGGFNTHIIFYPQKKTPVVRCSNLVNEYQDTRIIINTPDARFVYIRLISDAHIKRFIKPNKYKEDPKFQKAVPNTAKTEQVSFLIVLFTLIITGNCTVLIILFLSGKIRSRMNLFMANLACADLMVGIFLVLTDVISKITITWETPDPGCKIVKFLQAFSTYASAFSLVALSIDRLSVVIRPLNRAGNGKSWTLIALAWIFAALFAFPMLLLFFVKEEQNMKFCKIEFSKQWMWQVYMSLNAAAVFIIPAVIVAFCYIVIVAVLWRKANFAMGNDTCSNGCSPQHIINKDGHTVPQQKEKKVRWNSSSRGVIPKAKIKTIKMTFVIVLAFIFCWSPYFVFDLLFVYKQIPDPNSQHIIAINIFIQSLAPLNSAANPFIFLLFNFNTVKSACGRHNRHLYSPPTTQSHL